ncbi:MAG: aminodeoxychorismate synthase component I [Deltaproteobacteria bacterium]
MGISAIFLDSGGGWAGGDGASFMALREPEVSISSGGEGVKLKFADGRELESAEDPLLLLERYTAEGLFAAGYIGYEFSKFTEQGFSLSSAKTGVNLPDFYFGFYRGENVFRGKIHELIPVMEEPCAMCVRKVERAAAKREYIGMVKRAREYIARGDIYQTNLSQIFSTRLAAHPLLYFLRLYRIQPTPFACYMDFGGFQLVGGSMELFLRKMGRRLTTKPIKGTIRRSALPEEDSRLRVELLQSEKERAENLMIVDLMRNDLSRVCRYGTVGVKTLFGVESYSTLHQLVSEIEGELRQDASVSEIIRATFPPGSVTGAPKRRAIEIINELERHRRGPYCGAIGLFSPDGDFTLSVAIRILAATGGRGTFWTGSGIVWDSVPEREYEETILKAEAMRRAIGAG